MTQSSLNGLDWQLLELLRSDGRMSISRLASELGRSRSTISEHLARLQDSGVLTGTAVQIDEEKLGFGLSAFVRLQAASTRHREIINAIVQLPEVAECHVLTGTDLLMLRLLARDMPHLRTLVDDLTQYGATTTDVIFSTVKSQPALNQALKKAASPSTAV